MQEILGPQLHVVFVDLQIELAVDPEPPDPSETVPVVVEELLSEELPGLLDLGWVARAQPRVEVKQGRLVFADPVAQVDLFLVGERVGDQLVVHVRDDVNLLEVRREDLLDRLTDRRAGTDQLLAGFGVDDRGGGKVLGLQVGDLDALHVVERIQELLGGRDRLVDRPQEDRRGDLRRLVDPHLQDIFFGDLQLDPRPTLGDDPC